MITSDNDMIYFSGYTAGEMGLTIDDNPFEYGTTAYSDWLDGYRAWMDCWLLR